MFGALRSRTTAGPRGSSAACTSCGCITAGSHAGAACEGSTQPCSSSAVLHSGPLSTCSAVLSLICWNSSSRSRTPRATRGQHGCTRQSPPRPCSHSSLWEVGERAGARAPRSVPKPTVLDIWLAGRWGGASTVEACMGPVAIFEYFKFSFNCCACYTRYYHCFLNPKHWLDCRLS